MKKICLFVNLLLIVSISASAQTRRDTLFIIRVQSKDTIKPMRLPVLPFDYYSSNIGFFCKKELQVERAVRFPVKFRLGSVAYCDGMEGKNAMYR